MALGYYMRNSTKSKGASPAESPDKKEANGRRAAMREGKVPEGAVDLRAQEGARGRSRHRKGPSLNRLGKRFFSPVGWALGKFGLTTP